MPLFPNASTYFKGKSHTQLVISEGNAPAERYIPSRTENANVKFSYEFGPEGNQEVVIPKGKAVALAGVEWDYETEKYVPALKVADGSTDSVIGVNHHNVYRRIRDRFSGNQPTVITREYIEVPFFSSKAAAAAINFGAAWVDGTVFTDKVAQANAILGQEIVVDENGNYTIKDANGDATEEYANYAVIGTCLGVETDIPPAGYLQYFMEMDDNAYLDFLRQMSYAPSAGRTTDAEWNDIGTYPEGSTYLTSREDLIKNFRSGIPFLTDGYFKARTELTSLNGDSAEVVDITMQGDITYDPDTSTSNFTVNAVEGAAIYVRFDTKTAKFATDIAKEDVASVAGFAAEDVHIDYTNNQIVLYPQSTGADTLDITSLQVVANQIPGIPTGWDFANSLGGVRILLQK
jgi:hypothetical protein